MSVGFSAIVCWLCGRTIREPHSMTPLGPECEQCTANLSGELTPKEKRAYHDFKARADAQRRARGEA